MKGHTYSKKRKFLFAEEARSNDYRARLVSQVMALTANKETLGLLTPDSTLNKKIRNIFPRGNAYYNLLKKA